MVGINSNFPTNVLSVKNLSSVECPDFMKIKVVIITNLGKRQKSAINTENKTDLPKILQVPSLYSFS